MNGCSSVRLRYTISSFTPRAASRGAGGCSVAVGASALTGAPFPTGDLLWDILSRGCGLDLSGAALSALVGDPCGAWPHPLLCPPACPYPGPQPFPGLALRRPIPGSGKIHHFPSGGGLSHAGNRGLLLVLTRLRRTLYLGGLRLGWGGLILHRGSSFGRLHLSRLGGLSTFPASGILFLSSAT